MDSHCFRNLRGVKLGIRLKAGVGRAGSPALIEHDLPVHTPPALRQHTVCGELWAGIERRPQAAPIACKGNQRQNIAKSVVIKVIIGEFSLKSFLNHPITVIQGQALADVDNAHRSVQIQPALGQERMGIRSILWNYAMAQPTVQAVRRQVEVKRQQCAPVLVYPKDVDLRRGSVIRGGELDQRRIKLFEDVGHQYN